MRIVEKTDTFLKIENSSMSIFCYLLGEFLFYHFVVFSFSIVVFDGLLEIFSNPNFFEILFSLIWLPPSLCVCGLIVFMGWIIQFWMGKYKKQKYLIFNKNSGEVLIKKKGLLLSLIRCKKLNKIKQVEIVKKGEKDYETLTKYETRLVFYNGEKMYLDILFNNNLSHHKEIAQSINQFLNISPEPDLIVE
ncbi:MAG: hypothetical protein GVY17_00025 [Cyanobacteria bacterium]|jgi:hypothetical protein|nr:hypothetical protein [Cyanobacteria bacterium GSL.Bin21]